MIAIINTINNIEQRGKVSFEELLQMEAWSFHEESEIRSRVAEILVLAAPSIIAQRILLRLCEDDNELVRVNACDSLSCYSSKTVIETLINVFSNIQESELVRWYSLMSIIDIVEEDYALVGNTELLCKSAMLESSVRIRGAGYMGLYILGDKSKLTPLVSLLSSNRYEDRCAIVCMLENIVDNSNKSMILNTVKKQLEREPTGAMRSKLSRLISFIEQSEKTRHAGDGSE